MEDGKTSQNPRGSAVKRVVLTVAVVIAGTGAILGGAFATFTDTTSAGPQTISSGKLVLAVGPVNDSTVAATSIAPGDTIPREVDLNSLTSNINDATITLGISASPSSLLDTDPNNGLHVQVQTCSVAWTRVVGPPPTYTCSGTTVTVLASTPVATLEATPASLTPLNSLTAGGQDFVVMTFTFPATAPGNVFQVATLCSGTTGGTSATENLEGCSSTLTYNFTATQRAGTSK
ncbi:MAG: TasA family protein [Candidatus Dormibacteria bacterium]|jgi:predicted ribosomally synthesized peptide with SipW-like signal peptide